MIYVDRSAVPAPKTLELRARPAMAQLEEFFAQDLKQRAQKTPKFNSSIWKWADVTEALRKLFRGKCAFCEGKMQRGEFDVAEHFRPKMHAAQLNGRVDADHYWWLAYEWNNLYVICKACNHARGTRFPVAGRRAPPGARGGDLDRESPLLLDPCRDEYPEQSLDFLEDGSVVGRDTRGTTTIEVFALNRLPLVESRRDHCGQVDANGAEYLMGDDPRKWKLEDFVRMMVELAIKDGNPFIALTRQQAQRYFERVLGSAPASKSAAFVYEPRDEQTPYRGAIWVDRIEIENFKALKHLDLTFPPPASPAQNDGSNLAGTEVDDEQNEPWLMLLGENGVGKSSVLKAIALTLMPATQRKAIMCRPGDWLTRGVRANAGIIRLSFTVGADPVELHFSKKSTKLTMKGEFPRVSVLGYGSTRLLPPVSKSGRPSPRRIRIENLFSSRAPLRDAERWLASSQAIRSRDFNLLATSLKTILSLGEDDRIVRREGKLSVRVFNDVIPIRELSDGYQSVLALATDMMLNLSQATFDMGGVEGVVLIDELEVHLHPRWKIQIVSALRRMFPRVRFIATTHDPLCVQGLRPGELHVMARNPKTNEVRTDQVDVPPGTRADQILTGAWFGLPSTRDPQTLALMREHSDLLLRLNKTAVEDQRLAQLEELLKQRLQEYAGTSIEQLGMQAAAEVIREQPAADAPAERDHLKAKILERLRVKTTQAGQ